MPVEVSTLVGVFISTVISLFSIWGGVYLVAKGLIFLPFRAVHSPHLVRDPVIVVPSSFLSGTHTRTGRRQSISWVSGWGTPPVSSWQGSRQLYGNFKKKPQSVSCDPSACLNCPWELFVPKTCNYIWFIDWGITWSIVFLVLLLFVLLLYYLVNYIRAVLPLTVVIDLQQKYEYWTPKSIAEKGCFYDQAQDTAAWLKLTCY